MGSPGEKRGPNGPIFKPYRAIWGIGGRFLRSCGRGPKFEVTSLPLATLPFRDFLFSHHQTTYGSVETSCWWLHVSLSRSTISNWSTIRPRIREKMLDQANLFNGSSMLPPYRWIYSMKILLLRSRYSVHEHQKFLVKNQQHLMDKQFSMQEFNSSQKMNIRSNSLNKQWASGICVYKIITNLQTFPKWLMVSHTYILLTMTQTFLGLGKS